MTNRNCLKFSFALFYAPPSLMKASSRRSGLRSWRFVFLFPTTGYLTPKTSASCIRRTFFVHQRPLRERALDGQDYEAGASFSFFLPRVILRKKVKAHPAVAGLLFSYVPLPYESELSTVECHTKKTQPHGCAFTFFRDPDRIRTCDPQLRRLLLYPAELPDQSLKKWVQI